MLLLYVATVAASVVAGSMFGADVRGPYPERSYFFEGLVNRLHLSSSSVCFLARQSGGVR